MRKGIVVSVVNHKGGCAKTTVTTNLAAGLARSGKKVLVIDFDAQQNLTIGLIGQLQPEEGRPTLYDALLDETGLDHLIRGTNTQGLDIIPVTEEFVEADLNLVSALGREFHLRTCLKKTERLGDYDVVLIDNSPSISLVVMNSLVASDYFVVPNSAEYLSMVGLSLLSGAIARMSKLAPDLRPLGVIITLFARNETICRQVDTLLRKELGENVFRTKIRVNTKAKAAPSKGQTIFEYENSAEGRGTQDYTELAKEFWERLEAWEVGDQKVANG